MMVASQMYAKLFRPWDLSSSDSRNVPLSVDFETCKDNNKTFHEERIKLCSSTTAKTNEQRIKKNQTEKANKLRKIRNRLVHQDSTISTTTVECHEPKIQKEENDIKKLEEINKRLGCASPVIEKNCGKFEESKRVKSESVKLHSSLKQREAEIKKTENIATHLGVHHPLHYGYPEHLLSPVDVGSYNEPYSPTIQRFPSDLIYQTEFAQSLGIAPTDPLLMESFAQGYAMELEYARILHEENQAKILNAKKQRPKKYKCPHCDVGFSNNGQLKGHIRIHTGERPFKCDDKNCGKTFTRNEELTRHRRIHSGLRPYPCPTCGKKFGRRDHLKKHTKTHLAQAERMMPMFVPLTALPPQYPYLYGY